MLKNFFRRRAGRSPSFVPRVAPEERIYAIGDIHGRHDLLERMLARIEADAASRRDGRTARLVFLGDYIDRGDETRQTLDLLAQLQRETPADRVTFLRGNHEVALMEFLDDPLGGRAWLDFGGRQTLASYGVPVPGLHPDEDALLRAHAALRSEIAPHLNFLRDSVITAHSGDAVFVHACHEPAAPLEAQPEAVALWGAAPSAPPNPKLLVVHGHFDAAEPVNAPLRICVDTGAYHSGRLTAVRLDDGRAFLTAD